MIKLGNNLFFDNTRGIYFHTEGKDECIAGVDGYVTPLFVMALEGKLAAIFDSLMQHQEWKRLSIKSTFTSYVQLCHFVSLLEHDAVLATIPKAQKDPLERLVRAYLQWVIEREDSIVQEKPWVWFEPAFYPAGVVDQTGGEDIYNQYDAIPFGGFARAAFIFFIANTAKDAIKTGVQSEDLLTGTKEAIATCKAIFDDRDNVKLKQGMFRRLLETYLDWRYQQMELVLAYDVTLVEDDLWQRIYDEESRANELFKENMDKCRLYSLRPLLELQDNLKKRMLKEHPFISSTGKRINPNNLPSDGDYVALVAWLEAERLEGRDHLANAGGKVTKLCKDIQRIIGWDYIEADSLRTALRRKNSKK